MSLGVDSVEAHHLDVLFVGCTLSLSRRFWGLDLTHDRRTAQGQGKEYERKISWFGKGFCWQTGLALNMHKKC